MSRISKAATAEHEADLLDKTSFGFWVYLMTDLVLFATLFATYAVLHTSTAGGPTLGELFSLPYVLVETILLLTSSFVCGLMLLAAKQDKRQLVLAGLGVTFALGVAFLGMELHEFRALVVDGHSWRESGALSSFFTLVGTHGAHIAAGLIWMAVLAVRVWQTGINSGNLRRLTILSLFWRFLDIVWIFIFTCTDTYGLFIRNRQCTIGLAVNLRADWIGTCPDAGAATILSSSASRERATLETTSL